MLRKAELRVIYAQGVEAVERTIRQLSEMIEVEDERVQQLVTLATAAHLRKIEHLTGRLAKLEAELASKVRQVHQLNLTVRELNQELKEARQQTRLAREAPLAHLLKNSQTSSQPPAQDPRQRTRS